MLRSLIIAAVLALSASLAGAEDRVTLGWGRLLDNDLIGDGKDRWQSGAYTVSRLRGASWSGYDSLRPGDLLELRGHAAVIAPANLVAPSPTDRRYAGILSLGLTSHFGWRGAEVELGGDLTLTGPATGVSEFQEWFHDLTGSTPPSSAVLNAQIGNRLHPGLNAEIGRSYTFGRAVSARPFVEARAGLETLIRVGGDITIGSFGQDDLLLRDAGSGQRYRGVAGDLVEGLSLTIGGDVAQVFESDLLPEGGASTLSDVRTRWRAGLHWQGKRGTAFYGVSYLSPEFDEQPKAQLVGSLSLNLRF